MLYDKAGAPPLESPLEVISLLVQKMREERRYLLERATMLATVGQHKEALEVFNDYTRQVFFVDEQEKQKKKRDPREILKKWMGRGPIKLSPPPPDVQSRLRSKFLASDE